MLNLYKKHFSSLLVTTTVIFSFFLGGCAIGTTRLDINHEPLDHVINKKEGNILITQFVDNREEINKEFIGNKRNGFGMVLGHLATKEDLKLETILTNYFAEALEEVGYDVVIQEDQSSVLQDQEKFDLIINGEINQFWLDLYMAVWTYLDVNIEAIDPLTQSIVWEKDIKGDEKNVLWFGVTSEFEKVISQSLTKALNRAVIDFSSDDFYTSLSEKDQTFQVTETRPLNPTAERLQVLKKLYESGLITNVEYAEKRNEIIEGL